MPEEPRWTLKQLVAAIGRVLAEQPEPAGDSKRVRWNPNARLVRYYTTLGLLDRPVEFRGRTALYSWRHLLQLLAIKRLQRDGATLADIQGRLGGLPSSRLASIASPPPTWKDLAREAPPPASPVAVPSESAGTPPEAPRFWERPPASRDPRPPRRAEEPPAPTGPGQALRLTPEVLLVLTDRALTAAERARVRAAAAPLIEVLESIQGKEPAHE